MLHPKVVRNDFFDRHDYTLHVAHNVNVRLTREELWELFGQLVREFEPPVPASIDWGALYGG